MCVLTYWEIWSTHARTHTCFTFIFTIAYKFRWKDQKWMWWMSLFRVIYIHYCRTLTRTHIAHSTYKTTYVKYAAIFHKLLLIFFPSCLLLLLMWATHSIIGICLSVLSCFVVIFVCPLRAMHRNYNEQINRLFLSFICCHCWNFHFFFFRRF